MACPQDSNVSQTGVCVTIDNTLVWLDNLCKLITLSHLELF